MAAVCSRVNFSSTSIPSPSSTATEDSSGSLLLAPWSLIITEVEVVLLNSRDDLKISLLETAKESSASITWTNFLLFLVSASDMTSQRLFCSSKPRSDTRGPLYGSGQRHSFLFSFRRACEKHRTKREGCGKKL